jgi:uncharacterized protein with PIN domain
MKAEGEKICQKCNLKMQEMDTEFSYLGRSFRHKVLRCEKCGQVYIPKELATGRMQEVEQVLEEK